MAPSQVINMRTLACNPFKAHKYVTYLHVKELLITFTESTDNIKAIKANPYAGSGGEPACCAQDCHDSGLTFGPFKLYG
jgi:hypothetical protein